MSNKATIVVGPQGSGKTTKAREIASGLGAFVEIPAPEFLGGFGLGACADSPQAVIIEEELASDRDHVRLLQRLKSLIVNPTVRIDRKHKEPITIKTPHFILVSGNAAPMIDDERRFCIVECTR